MSVRERKTIEKNTIKIGRTTFVVTRFFNEESKEYLSDKIIRLIDRNSRSVCKEYFCTLDKRKDISYDEDDIFAFSAVDKKEGKDETA